MKNAWLIAIFASVSLYTSAQKTVYVSPSGNDSWTGEQHKPFKSLHRALEENQKCPDTLFIQVASGDYLLDKPLDLSAKVTCPVVVRGNKDNMPRFLGAIRIQQWEKCGDRMYRAYIPEVKLYGYSFEQFFVNGKRAQLARTPDKDWFYTCWRN